jgi:hypothetical protein
MESKKRRWSLAIGGWPRSKRATDITDFHGSRSFFWFPYPWESVKSVADVVLPTANGHRRYLFREYFRAYSGTGVFGSSLGSLIGAPGTMANGITPAQVGNE